MFKTTDHSLHFGCTVDQKKNSISQKLMLLYGSTKSLSRTFISQSKDNFKFGFQGRNIEYLPMIHDEYPTR